MHLFPVPAILMGLLAIPANAGLRRVPSDFPTIQQAINASSPGDTVLVSEGRYYENIRFMGKAITVCSEYAVDGDTGHVSRTIIDGSMPNHTDSGSVVMFVDGEDTTSVLCGFTVTGGTGSWFASGGVTVRAGGGIFLESSGASIVANIIQNNRCGGDVSIASGGGISAGPPGSNAFVVVENNTVRYNSVSGLRAGRGGGIDIFLNCRISNNLVSSDTAFSATEMVFGGGIVVARAPAHPQPYVVVCDNAVSRNVAICTNGWASGGGMAVSLTGPHAKAVISRNEILYNQVAGGPYAGRFDDPDAIGGGLYLWADAPATCLVDGNRIAGNGPVPNSSCVGGGIGSFEANMVLQNNVIIRNTAREGGGIWLYAESGNAVLMNNTITGNTGFQRGGALTAYNCNVTVANSILWGNQAAAGSEIYYESSDNKKWLTVLHSDVQGGWAGTRNIDEDPEFDDHSLYELSETSRCLGAGIDSLQVGSIWYHAPSADYAGHVRPDPQGSHPDIGARESPLGWPRGQAAVSVTPPAIDFQNVHPGSESDTARVIIENRGEAELAITSVTTGSSEFVPCNLPPVPATLPPFQIMAVDLLFRPPGAGIVLEDTLAVLTSDPLNPLVSVRLRGRGSAPVQGAPWGTLYGISSGIRLYTIDRTTGAVSAGASFSPDPPDRVSGFAVRPSDSTLYAARSDSAETRLYRLSREFGDVEPAGSVPLGDVSAMTFSRSDELYLADTKGNLYRSDTVGRAPGFVGWTGLRFTGLAFSPATGMLWGSARDSFYTIDPATAGATLVGSTGWNVEHSSITFNPLGGMYVLYGNRLLVMDRVTGQVTEIGMTGDEPLLAIAMRDDMLVDVGEEGRSLPSAWRVYQNYPNPFNPATTIAYEMPERAHVTLKVYNTLGQEVAALVDEIQEPGYRSVRFEGSGFPSAVYLYRLIAGGRSFAGKMLLLR